MSTSFLIEQKQPFQHSAFLFFVPELNAELKQDVSAIVLQYLHKNLTTVYLSENDFILSQIYKEECHCDSVLNYYMVESSYEYVPFV